MQRKMPDLHIQENLAFLETILRSKYGRTGRIRTADLLHVKQAL